MSSFISTISLTLGISFDWMRGDFNLFCIRSRRLKRYSLRHICQKVSYSFWPFSNAVIVCQHYSQMVHKIRFKLVKSPTYLCKQLKCGRYQLGLFVNSQRGRHQGWSLCGNNILELQKGHKATLLSDMDTKHKQFFVLKITNFHHEVGLYKKQDTNAVLVCDCNLYIQTESLLNNFL